MTGEPIPRMSCVVCTYRNPDLLRGVLVSLQQQTLSPDAYEVIVVDNNSQDDTESITRAFMQESGNIRYVLETRQGLGHARNAGIQAARAAIIAFTDDDAEVAPGWLEALLAVYDAQPDAWAVGGRVTGLWQVPRPDWLTEDMDGHLSLRDYGDEMRPLVWPERIIGVNCSFRRVVFEEIGAFVGGLGRKGRVLLGHEDTEIQQRIHEMGKLVYYTPDALVKHLVPAERATLDYFKRRFYGAGRSLMLVELMQEGPEVVRRNARQRLWTVIRQVMPLRYSPHSRLKLRRRSYKDLWKRTHSNIGYLHQYVRTQWLGLDRPDAEAAPVIPPEPVPTGHEGG